MVPTHQKRQQEERQAQVQLDALGAAAHGIILTDKAGKILFANRAFCSMTGYAPEEVLGQTPGFLKSGKHNPAFYRQLWETILAGRVWQGQIINRRKDGTLFNEEMTITPVRELDGQISSFLAIKKDVTRDNHLREQLHHMQKMEAIGHLAGGVAHDFNNLLTVIHGNAQLLLADEAAALSAEHRRCLLQITEAAERAANITRQLLAFGRRQSVQFQPLNLNHVVGCFTKMLKRVIGENVALQCHSAQNLPPVNGDIGMIEQVLISLTVRARDAMPEGGSITITTDTVHVDSDNAEINPEVRAEDFACITVSDTGAGIDPKHLPRIFEPFFTTQNADKDSGLGLAAVYGIVKQHQGWIEVVSKPGGGTKFKIFLPSIPSEAGVAKNSQPVIQQAAGIEKILLVEDDMNVRMVARDVLEASGYHVWEASDGIEALNIWKANAPQIDLLLTDMIMPGGLNGRELADRLRCERPGLKVLLMSGYSGDRLENIQACNRILSKPFSLESLTKAVRNCLDTASVD